jgi:hypothetical protein
MMLGADQLGPRFTPSLWRTVASPGILAEAHYGIYVMTQTLLPLVQKGARRLDAIQQGAELIECHFDPHTWLGARQQEPRNPDA